MKRGVRSLPMRSVPSRRSTLALPAEGRPGPSDDDDDEDYMYINALLYNVELQIVEL